MAVLSKHQRRVVGVVFLGGGALVGGRLLQLSIKSYQKEQNALCETHTRSAAQQSLQPRKPKVGVIFPDYDELLSSSKIKQCRCCNLSLSCDCSCLGMLQCSITRSKHISG